MVTWIIIGKKIVFKPVYDLNWKTNLMFVETIKMFLYLSDAIPLQLSHL